MKRNKNAYIRKLISILVMAGVLLLSVGLDLTPVYAAGTITNADDPSVTYNTLAEAFSSVGEGDTLNLAIAGEVDGNVTLNKEATVSIAGEGMNDTTVTGDVTVNKGTVNLVDLKVSNYCRSYGGTMNLDGVHTQAVAYSGDEATGSISNSVLIITNELSGIILNGGVQIANNARVESIDNTEIVSRITGVVVEKGSVGLITNCKITETEDDEYYAPAAIFVKKGAADNINTIDSISKCELYCCDHGSGIIEEGYARIEEIDNCYIASINGYSSLSYGIRKVGTTSSIGSITNCEFWGCDDVMYYCIWNKGGTIEKIKGCKFILSMANIANGYPDTQTDPNPGGVPGYIEVIDDCTFAGEVGVHNAFATEDNYSYIGKITNSKFYNSSFGQDIYARIDELSNCSFESEGMDFAIANSGEMGAISDCTMNGYRYGIVNDSGGLMTPTIDSITGVTIEVKDGFYGSAGGALVNGGNIKTVVNSSFTGVEDVIRNLNGYGMSVHIGDIENVTVTGEETGILNEVTIDSLKNVSVKVTGDTALYSGTLGKIDGGSYIAGTNSVVIPDGGSLDVITGGPVFCGLIKNNSDSGIIIEPELEEDSPTQGYARYSQGLNSSDPVVLPLYKAGTPQRYTMSTLTEPVEGIDGVDFHYLKVDVRVQYNGNSNNASGDMSGDAYQNEWIPNLKAEENGFTNGDKIFEGWNTEPDGSGIAYAPGQKIDISRASMTLYAQWADPTHTVSFDSDGGTKVDSQTVVHKDMAKEPKAPTRENYTFVAWLLNGEKYNFDTPVTEDITLKALWERNPEAPATTMHTITYDLNGGTLYGETGIIEVQYDEGTTIQLPKPEKEGCIFDYWEGSRYEAGDDYTIMGDHTFTAHWIKEETRFEEETEFQDEDENCEEEDEDNPEGTPVGSTSKINKKSPKTADDSDIFLWIAMMCGASLAAAGSLKYRKRRR